MPVVSMMTFAGDPDELAAKIAEHVAPVSMRLAPTHGGLANIVARTDDGLLLINLWENDEGRHTMAAEPEIQAAVRAAGLPQPAFDGHEVLVLNVNEKILAAADGLVGATQR